MALAYGRGTRMVKRRTTRRTGGRLFTRRRVKRGLTAAAKSAAALAALYGLANIPRKPGLRGSWGYKRGTYRV